MASRLVRLWSSDDEVGPNDVLDVEVGVDFIISVLQSSQARELVENEHRSRFKRSNAAIIDHVATRKPVLAQKLADVEASLRSLDRDIAGQPAILIEKETEKRFSLRAQVKDGGDQRAQGSAKQDPAVSNQVQPEPRRSQGPTAQEGPPRASAKAWTGLDVVTFAMTAGLSFVAICAGIVTVYTYIVSSGLIPAVIDNPLLAFIFGTIPLLMVLFLKWVGTASPRLTVMKIFAISWGVIGSVGAIVWVTIFAAKFGSALQGDDASVIRDIMRTPTLGAALDQQTWNNIFIFAQVVAEVFISAALWIFLHVMWEERHVERRIINRIRKDLDAEKRQKQEERNVILREQTSLTRTQQRLIEMEERLVKAALTKLKRAVDALA